MPKYNWDEVQAFYDQGHTAGECGRRFGFTATTWTAAAERGAIKRRPRRRIPILEYLERKSATRWSVRQRLLDEGLLRRECYECGVTEWFGERLPLHLDHINGMKTDRRLENLRMLCPNCHSQTETFGAKNLRGRKRNG